MMMVNNVLAIVCFWVFLQPQVKASSYPQGTREFQFQKLNSICENNPHPDVIYDFKDLKIQGRQLLINFTIDVKKDMTNSLSMSIDIQRCRNKENPDTCEHFNSLKTRHFCKFLDNHSTLWKGFYTTITPRFVCPIKKAIYVGTNSVIDMIALVFAPQEGWFWKMQVKMTGPDKIPVGCINADFLVSLRK